MGRKQKSRAKKNRRSATDGNTSTSPDRIQAQLERGATKTALAEAKVLARSRPGRETSELLAKAYQARAQALLAAGLEQEAAELLQQAEKRFQEVGGTFSKQATRLSIRAGQVDGLLQELDAPSLTTDRKQELEALLERNLLDPRVVARSRVLDEDHPLRQAASAVSRALAEAAEGALGDEARAALGQVGRRSPLAPWRSFVLALDAFHGGRDDAMRAALARIPEHAPVARLGRILESLVEGRLPREMDQGQTVHSLLRSMVGAAVSVDVELARVLEALDDGDFRKIKSAMKRLLKETAAANPVAACRLVGRLVVNPTSFCWIQRTCTKRPNACCLRASSSACWR